MHFLQGSREHIRQLTYCSASLYSQLLIIREGCPCRTFNGGGAPQQRSQVVFQPVGRLAASQNRVCGGGCPLKLRSSSPCDTRSSVTVQEDQPEGLVASTSTRRFAPQAPVHIKSSLYRLFSY